MFSFVDVNDTLGIYIPGYSIFANHLTDLGPVKWVPEIEMDTDRNYLDVQTWLIGTLASMVFPGVMLWVVTYAISYSGRRVGYA